MDKYDFHKTKYGSELLIDLIRLESLEKYIKSGSPHVLSYFDITLILEGSGKIFIDTNTYELYKNLIVCSSPMQVRKWQIKDIPRGLVLIFEEEFLNTFFNDSEFVTNLSFFNTSENRVLKLSEEKSSHIKELFLNIEAEIHKHYTGENHILRALLYQTLVRLDREFKPVLNLVPESGNGYITKLEKLVSRFICKEHSVSFYASELNISPGYLNDVVKAKLGVSVKRHIQKRLILEAKKMLKHTTLSVSEIAWKLNFKDDSYFVRAFKKATGYTPNQYRKGKNP